MSITVFIEVRDGVAKKSSLEALSEAKRQADKHGPVTAVVIGSPCEEAVKRVSAYKPDTIRVADDALFAAYSVQAYSAALAAAIRADNSDAVFVSATAMGRELAARTAAKFQTSVLADVVSIDWSIRSKPDDPFIQERPSPKFRHRAQSLFSCPFDPISFLWVRPTGAINLALRNLMPESVGRRKGDCERSHKTVTETVELTEADAVVSAVAV